MAHIRDNMDGVPGNSTLKAFIVESKTRLKKILERLEWNVENTFVETSDSLDATQKDIQPDVDSEPEFPSSYGNSNSIRTDITELREIVNDECIEVPRKFSDLQLNFKREQKLAIYEHVVAKTEKGNVPVVTVPALKEGSLTFADIVAEKKRETKKRRRYRRSKPTHIEEVRAVVDLQMQALQEYLQTKSAEEHNIKSKYIQYKAHKRQSTEDHKRFGKRTIRKLEKHYQCHKSRSRSADCKSSNQSRHRSRSPTRSHKHKEHVRDRSSSRKRKKHKHRSRSHSKNSKIRSPKQRSRSRGIKKKSHKRRRSHSRDRQRRKSSHGSCKDRL